MKGKNLEKGQKGEVKVIEKLISEGAQVNDYTDYTLYKHKQHKGYDIEVLNPSTKEWDRVDIKSNVKNGYLYLEDKKKDKLGWFWTSSADSIYHYDLVEDTLYGYILKNMRNYVYKNNLQPNYGREKDLIGIKISENKLIKKL
jgi:hypothetical protein